MFKKIRMWLREAKMERTHAKLEINDLMIWVQKEFRDDLKLKIEGIITMAKLMNYSLVTEFEKHDGKKRYVIEIYEKEKQTRVYPHSLRRLVAAIHLGVKGDIIRYMSTVEMKTNELNQECKCFNYCGLRYKKFIKKLDELPGLF